MFKITIPPDLAAMAKDIASIFREHAQMEMQCGTDWRRKVDTSVMMDKLAKGEFDSPQQASDIFKFLVSAHNRIEADPQLSEIYPELLTFFGIYEEELGKIKSQIAQFQKHTRHER